MDILILGCGFTGRRVAERFLVGGARVTVTTRRPERLANLDTEIIDIKELPKHARPGIVVLHSIPPNGPPDLLGPLKGVAERVVYLSSTAVYGAVSDVDESTPAEPNSYRARARLEAEREIVAGPWSSLILRPAAIYGPGRGVQESIQRGEHSLSDRFVSRIHVDDLAAHAVAALRSDLTGAFPVADEEPCTSHEIAEFCARLLNLPVAGAPREQSGREPRFAANRKVDGSAIRRALGIALIHPSYRQGIPASLRE
ncbi:MAG TPA: NAD-dependent epimerase/dehydratase family protein [Bryobacteraceae bacterium]